jgi:hypothetical protein
MRCRRVFRDRRLGVGQAGRLAVASAEAAVSKTKPTVVARSIVEQQHSPERVANRRNLTTATAHFLACPRH